MDAEIFDEQNNVIQFYNNDENNNNFNQDFAHSRSSSPLQVSYHYHNDNNDHIYYQNNNNNNNNDKKNLKNYNDDSEYFNGVSLQHIPLSMTKIHTDNINSLSISPNGQSFATVGDDYRLVLYSIKADDSLNSNAQIKCLRRIKKKYLPLNVSFDNTGDCLAISMIDGIIEIWDVKTMKPIYALKGHTGSVLKSMWSPSHRNTLASISNDQTIRIWHPHSMPANRCAHVKNCNYMITDLSWQQIQNKSPLFGIADNNYTLRIYETKNNDYKENYVGRSVGNKLCFGQNKIIGVNGYDLNIFDAYHNKRGGRLKGHKELINQCAIQCGDQQQLVASSDNSNNIYLWKLENENLNGNCLGTIPNAHNCNDKQIVSNKKSKIKQQTQQTEKKIEEIIQDIDLNDDDNSNNRNKQNRNGQHNNDDEDEDENENKNDDGKNYITNLEFVKDQPWLISTGKDGTVKLWDCSRFYSQKHRHLLK